jgi:AcrR family transcriptional regulator
MGTTERREREKAELRQKIMEAARELFMAQGAESVTMRKIAERIEYSPTAIYAYFPDKDALLTALCEHDFCALLSEGAHIFEIADPIERMVQASSFYIEFALRHPYQYQFMFMTGGLEGFTPSEASTVAYEFLLSTIREALDQHKFRSEWTEPHELLLTVWSALHGIASLEIAGRYAILEAHAARFKLKHKVSAQRLAQVAVEGMLRGFLRKPNELALRVADKTRAVVDTSPDGASRRPVRRTKTHRRKAS